MLNKIFHLSFSRGISVGINFAILIACSRYLTIEEYASFRQTFLPYEILSPVLTLGIPGAIYFLLPKREDKMCLLLESVIVIAISHTLFGIILFMGGDKWLAVFFNNPRLKDTAIWLVIYTITQSLIQTIISFLVFENKTKKIATITVASNLILLCGIMLALNTKSSLEIIVAAKAAIPITNLILLAIAFWNVTKSKKSCVINANNTVTLIKVALPFGLASSIGALSSGIDKIIVSRYGTTEEFGIYVNGAIEVPFIGIIAGSIAAVMVAEMSQRINDKDFSGALLLFRTAATKVALIIFPLMIALLFNAEDIIITLFTKKYQLSTLPFMIYLLLLPIRIVVFGSALVALGKNKIILYRSMIELLFNAVLSFIMFKIMGAWGVALAAVIVTYVWSVPYNLHAIANGFSVKMSEVLDFIALLKIMLISIGLSPIIYFIQIVVANRLMSITVSFVVYGALVLLAYHKTKYINISNINYS